MGRSSLSSFLPSFVLLLVLNSCGDDPNGPLRTSPHVVKDPNGIAPLSARLHLSMERPCRASLKVFGDPPVERSFPEARKEHHLPLVGLYPDSSNKVLLRLEDPQGKALWKDTLHVRTGPLPKFFPDIKVEQLDTACVSDGFLQGDLAIGESGVFHSMPFMMDERGKVRWYLDLKFMKGLAVPLRRLDNGHFVAGSKNKLCEMDLLGNKLRCWDLSPYSIHHEIRELPNGDLLMATSKDSTFIQVKGDTLPSINDHIVRFDRKKGKVVKEWDLREVLDVDRSAQASKASKDWIHVNSMEYVAEDSSIIVSAKKQGMFKLSMENELRWILAPHKGWERAGKAGKGPRIRDDLLRAVDSSGDPYPRKVQMGKERAESFDWPWGQHAPFLMENGDIMVFDNGFLRRFEKWREGYSRAVQYRVNEAKGTLREIWSFGKKKGDPFYSAIISDVDRVDKSGNLLVSAGTIDHKDSHYAQLYELAYPEKRVCYKAKLFFKDLRGSGKFKWGEFDILYRAERMSLYPPRKGAPS